jgi:type IV pilus assembly protein PilP
MMILKISGSVFLLMALLGCGASSEDDIRKWMLDERNQTRPQVKPIAAPKQFTPEAYTNGAATEPFSLLKLTQAFKKDSAKAAANASLVAPELLRRREALEFFPLDSMSFVGSIVKPGEPPVALLKVDSLLYHVKLGSYLGQNYGRITKVSETEVTLREIVQDASGEWIERIAMLQIKEGSK